MIGILVELILSWVVLWVFRKEHLSVLGFAPTKSRLLQFITGFFLAAMACTVYQLLTTAFAQNNWLLNRAARLQSILAGAWWFFKSVMYEELIFRGALLYIALKKMGAQKACILSATCFGIYHWFSYNLLGQPVPMIFVFLLTAAAGWAFAIAFAKTGSLYLPVALHFGWLVVNNVIFSSDTLSQQIFVKANHRNRRVGCLYSLTFFNCLYCPC